MSDSILVGLDIGGTKTAVQIVDVTGDFRASIVVPTVTSGSPDFVDALIATIGEALAQGGAGKEMIRSMGVGIPGLVNPLTGDVRLAVNLNLEAYPLGAVLQGIYGVPVVLENDVRMAAVGVYDRLQTTLQVGSLAYLSIGTGVSAGIILKSKLYRGANGMAGEIGHIVVDTAGPLCRCGQKGCLETFISGTGIVRNWLRLVEGDPGDQVTAKTVYEAAAWGDEPALFVIKQASTYMARAIQILFMSYDMEMIIMGGGVTRLGRDFLDPIAAELTRMGSQSDLVETMLNPAKVRLKDPDFDPATWGAIIMARKFLT